MGMLMFDASTWVELKVSNLVVKLIIQGIPECEDFVLGCTDFNACNFDSSATSDDGSCTYDCITSTPTTSDCSCPFDANNDGRVGISDLLDLLTEWGAC